MTKRKSIILECKNCKISWDVGFNRIKQDKITPCPVYRKINKTEIERASVFLLNK